MIVMIQGRTHEDRHSVTSAVSIAVGEVGGCILDYTQFLNADICFTIELPPAGFAKLRMKLADLKVFLEPPTKEEIAWGEKPADLEISCSLRITF